MTMVFFYSWTDQNPTEKTSCYCDYNEITIVTTAPIWRTLVFLEMGNGKKVLSMLFICFQDSELAGLQIQVSFKKKCFSAEELLRNV